MPKEETIEMRKVRNVLGELMDLPEDNPRATISSKIRTLLLRITGIPQLIHYYGTLALNKTLTLDTGENRCRSIFSDGSYLYAGLFTSPGKVVKIDLTDFTKVATLTFDTGENYCYTLFSDGSYLYAGLWIAPGKVVKIDLADFTKIATMTLDTWENGCCSLFSDGSYLYVGLYTSPGKVVKIDLADFTKIATMTLDTWENGCCSLFSDGSYLYVGLYTSPGKVVKIDLADFTKIATMTLDAGECCCLTLFSDGSYLYAGLFAAPGKVVKIDLADFTKVAILSFDTGENACYTLFSDGSYLYAGSDAAPGKVVKIDLADFTKIATMTFDTGEDRCLTLFSDGSYLYGGLYTAPAKIIRRYILPLNATLRERKIDCIYERDVEQSVPMSFYGKVTTYTDTTHFKAARLSGFGNDFFKDWYVYVVRDAGGAGAAPQGELQPISAYESADGAFTHTAFTTSLEVGDEVLILHQNIATAAINAELTTFKQETAAATDVNGTTWKDLLDKSTITKFVKICGFKITKGGTWAGNPKIRITDGSSNKIFPFQDEYVMGTDFYDATQYALNFPVVNPPAEGYKFQFRSSNDGDGSGETLELNNLDVIEIG